MAKEDFIDYEKVNKALEDNSFFGFTCKREKNGRLTYTYRSIKYHCVSISVSVAKLKPNELRSRKIVLNINVNGRNVEGWADFMDTLNNCWKIHNKAFQKTFIELDNGGHPKKNKHDNSGRKRSGIRNHTDDKNVQVVRKETRKEKA